MVRVSTAIKKARLRAIWARAKVAGVRLSAALDAELLSKDDAISDGSPIISVSGNGATVTKGQSGGFGSDGALTLVSELRGLYDEALAELGVDDVDEEADADADVFERMLTLLVPRNEAYTDRSAVRV